MSLLNPGTLTEYEGPSRSRRSRGTVRVRDPAHGFFIAGSSIDPGLNGIYSRIRPELIRFITVRRPMRLCYRHDKTGWLMVLVDIDPEEMEEFNEDDSDDDWRYGREDSCDMQWRLIDDKGRDRFRHKGDTIIPGAGTRWKHMRQDDEEKSEGKGTTSGSCNNDSENEEEFEECFATLEDVEMDGTKANSSAADMGEEIVEVKEEEPKEDDEDELPWQVIALLDKSVLEDLRFSSSHRDERVERALKGIDVEQPPETSIEGFLKAEESGKNNASYGAFCVGNNDTSPSAAPRGWLFRVVAEGGIDLYSAPSDCDEGDEKNHNGDDNSKNGVVTKAPFEPQRKVGKRYEHDFVRIVETRGHWLRLAPTERPLRSPPLAVGDKVRVISGHYSREVGEIVRELDSETREFGVKLEGYTGTGSLHISQLTREGPIPGSIADHANKKAKRRAKQAKRRRRREIREREQTMMQELYGDMYSHFMPQYYNDTDSDDTGDEAERFSGLRFGDSKSIGNDDEDSDNQGYDDSYTGPLWTKSSTSDKSQTLAQVELQNTASLKMGIEKEDSDLFDRPFEPRLEGGGDGASSEAKSPCTDLDDAGEDDADDCGEVVDLPEELPILCGSLGQALLTPSSKNKVSNDEDHVPVGSLVSLYELKNTQQYNNRFGTVITNFNANGRCGVRLDPVTCPEKRENFEEFGKILLLKYENLSVQSTVDVSISSQLSVEEKMEVERAARVLGVGLGSIGLGNTLIEPNRARQVLNALLRAAERDCIQMKSTISSFPSQQIMLDAVSEAKKAHTLLTASILKVAACDDHTEQASEAIKGEQSGLIGLAPHTSLLNGYLGARAKAAMAAALDKSSYDQVESGLNLLKILLSDEQIRLMQYQSSGRAKSSSITPYEMEQAEKEATNSLTNDCMRLRLSFVHACLSSNNITDATAAAEAAKKLYQNSAATHFLHARCLLRSGHRTDALTCLNSCVGLGTSGVCGLWAHREGVKCLRSLRRALKTEFKAKDSYERGNFSVAASLYGEMMTEYNNYSSDDKWGRAEALISRAACYRRDFDLVSALADCDSALLLFPCYPRALFRRALCLLESGRPKDALTAFEQLLRVDRKWPKLLDYLVRAVAQVKRMNANGGGQADRSSAFNGTEVSAGNEDYYAVLGVTSDATEAQLKRAYRLMSLKCHPDKKGGSTEAFHLVAEAYETLNDPEKRQLYDDGVDLSKTKKKKDACDESTSESEDEDGNKKKSVREEVERKYFPENFKFHPFGDPFINKRRHQARKRRQEEARKAKMNRRSHSWWNGYDDWDL